MSPATVLIRKFLNLFLILRYGQHWKTLEYIGNACKKQGLKSLNLFLYSSVCLNTWRGFLVCVFKLLGIVLSFKWIWLLFMCCRVASSTWQWGWGDHHLLATSSPLAASPNLYNAPRNPTLSLLPPFTVRSSAQGNPYQSTDFHWGAGETPQLDLTCS